MPAVAVDALSAVKHLERVGRLLTSSSSSCTRSRVRSPRVAAGVYLDRGSIWRRRELPTDARWSRLQDQSAPFAISYASPNGDAPNLRTLHTVGVQPLTTFTRPRSARRCSRRLLPERGREVASHKAVAGNRERRRQWPRLILPGAAKRSRTGGAPFLVGDEPLRPRSCRPPTVGDGRG